MRILSARATQIQIDRLRRRIDAVIVLRVDQGNGDVSDLRVPTSAPIIAKGAAPLKERLVASAKLMLAMSPRTAVVEDAVVIRPAA
ncbi:MAG: hypothetical protein WBC90_03675 [Albidovulum sp.]|jgi:hypothetical protein